MISRRGLLKMLGAVAASPALKPLTKMMPEAYTTYLVGADAIVSYNVRYAFGPHPGRTIRFHKEYIINDDLYEPDPKYDMDRIGEI